MYDDTYMYAIERSPEYLAHYGVRGMRWGVRKALERRDAAGLGRQYRKAQKKLAKLEKRAAKVNKYRRRAALMGAGAAAVGGMAIANPLSNRLGAHRAISSGAHLIGSKVAGGNPIAGTLGRVNNRAGMQFAQAAGGNAASRVVSGAHKSLDNLYNFAGKNSVASAAANAGHRGVTGIAGTIGSKVSSGKNAGILAGKQFAQGAGGNTASKVVSGAHQNLDKVSGISNGTLMRLGAGAIGAGLAVGAARNAYRAATAQKKADRFRSEMNKAFKGTQYANGGRSSQPRQGKKRRRNG